MIDRKAAITAVILILATMIASSWSLVHVYATDPERVTVRWWIFGHLLGPSMSIIMWLLIWRSARRYPNSHNLEAPLKKHFGFMLVSYCALIAMIQMVMLAAEFGIREPLHYMKTLPMAFMAVILIFAGNSLGKLPSPYKGDHPEPFSWDKMTRFNGWVMVIYGFGVLIGALTLPRWAIFPSLAASWILGMSLMLGNRYRLKREMKDEMR
jgi:hypothetical protein